MVYIWVYDVFFGRILSSNVWVCGYYVVYFSSVFELVCSVDSSYYSCLLSDDYSVGVYFIISDFYFVSSESSEAEFSSEEIVFDSTLFSRGRRDG